MKSLSVLCKPRASVFDTARRDTVLDLTDLLENKIDVGRFFSENYLTDGMKQLLRLGMRRLSGQSEQGIFLLSQAMGGGKTHCMVTLGLLAKHEPQRKPFLGDLYESPLTPKRCASLASPGVRPMPLTDCGGALAKQLGKEDQLKDHYSPLKAPGQTAWMKLLEGDPVLILLDELPPYLEDAKSQAIGNSDLSRVTATAISNLLVAVNKAELSNVCVVISDLKASHKEGSAQLHAALSDLQRETSRSAIELSPVRLNTDEIFHILRTRLFESMPAEKDIAAVADAYAETVREARGMDVTNANPDDYATQLRLSYPFHFSLRDLYARFRENPGFQQTRGLIRLMRVVTSQMWDSKRANSRHLIHPYDLNLNHPETVQELQSINPKLDNAIAHDIASNGNSVAERLDAERGKGITDAQDAGSLLLVASLAAVSGATLGLSLAETVAFLCAPGRDVAKLRKDVLGIFSTRAWYLHTDREGRLFFKDVQNVVAKLKTTAESFTGEISRKELRTFLEESFKPRLKKDCYQEVAALSPVDEIKIDKDKVTLVIAEPAQGGGLSPDLRKLHEDSTYKNRILFLSGEREVIQRLLERSAELKAIKGILGELEADKVPSNDPQLIAAHELQDGIQVQLLSAAREAFTRLYYPARQGDKDVLLEADFLMNFSGNEYHGEDQIREALKSKQKFTEDVDTDTFRKKCEQRLFTQQVMPWTDVKRRAATNPAWQWHIPSALDALKSRMIMEDQWREDGGLVDKGPFAPPETDVRVQELRRDDTTGVVELRLTPVHSDVVHYEIVEDATTGSAPVPDLHNFKTSELKLSFLAVDSTGKHQTGAIRAWTNRITLKHRFFQQGTELYCELQSAPPVPIRYSTDGSDPKQAGGEYQEPFIVLKGAVLVLAVASKDGIISDMLKADVPREATGVVVDKSRPAIWKRRQSFNTTRETFEFLDRIQKVSASVRCLRITVNGKDWLELTTSDTFVMNRATIEKLLTPIRETVGQGEVQLIAEALTFEMGKDLLDWVAADKVTLKPGEVEQPAA
jgi:hypothetical protein